MKRETEFIEYKTAYHLLTIDGPCNEPLKEGQVFTFYKPGKMVVYLIKKIEYEFDEGAQTLKTIVHLKE